MSDSVPPPVPLDWSTVVTELNGLATASLGRRADKVSNILAAADHSEAGVEAAVDQIAKMTIVFVDPVRLADLSYEMKAWVAARSGKPPPAPLGAAPQWTQANWDPGAVNALGSGGCIGATFVFLSVLVAGVCVVVGPTL